MTTAADRTAGGFPRLSRSARTIRSRATSSRRSTGRCRRARSSPPGLPASAISIARSDLAPAAERPLVELLARHRNEWRWGQTYTSADFGQHFMDNYGWVELFGTRGHFANDQIAAGFLLLGPDITYPDHHHIAEELYVPLTGGTEWRKGEGGFVGPRRPARSSTIRPMSATPCAPAPSRWSRSMSGAAGRWRRNRRSARAAGLGHSAGSLAFGQ